MFCKIFNEQLRNSWGKFSAKLVCIFYPFKHQYHKMVKHTQTIRRQFADEFFDCVWPLCEIGT